MEFELRQISYDNQGIFVLDNHKYPFCICEEYKDLFYLNRKIEKIHIGTLELRNIRSVKVLPTGDILLTDDDYLYHCTLDNLNPRRFFTNENYDNNLLTSYKRVGDTDVLMQYEDDITYKYVFKDGVQIDRDEIENHIVNPYNGKLIRFFDESDPDINKILTSYEHEPSSNIAYDNDNDLVYFIESESLDEKLNHLGLKKILTEQEYYDSEDFINSHHLIGLYDRGNYHLIDTNHHLLVNLYVSMNLYLDEKFILAMNLINPRILMSHSIIAIIQSNKIMFYNYAVGSFELKGLERELQEALKGNKDDEEIQALYIVRENLLKEQRERRR
jgi:hypothetical protein